MTLKEKLERVKQAAAYMLGHDDEPLAAREACAVELAKFVANEVESARKRETTARIERRAREKAVIAAQDALVRAKAEMKESKP